MPGSMLTSGEVVVADLGEPVGREAGYPRPVVVVTAHAVLAQASNVVHVVPITSTRRGFRSEIDIDPDTANGLTEPSAAQCQHLRAVSTDRLGDPLGNVGPAALGQIRETLADLLDL
jgi:mRNA interferase MazF